MSLVETTARMAKIAMRPFRKIKVKEHLGPGYKPTPKHCLQASRIVADEITVRLARRCKELKELPPAFSNLPFTNQVIKWYTQTCHELFQFTDKLEDLRKNPPEQKWFWMEQFGKSWPLTFFRSSPKLPVFSERTYGKDIKSEDLAPEEQDLDRMYELKHQINFISIFGTECTDPVLSPMSNQLVDKLFHVLERAVARHKPITHLVASETNAVVKSVPLDDLQEFLTKFHWQRIAVRLLIGHCVALSRPLPMDNMIGIFCTKTNIEEIVVESVLLAEEVCMVTYGCIPNVELSCTSTSIDLLYIPSHLQHIMFELLKNAMRAVIEKEQARVGDNGVICTKNIPPITVHWDLTQEHCVFEVRDQGLGIEEHFVNQVFLFHYTTAPKPAADATVMAGYGYGLPLSRLYARFLKGDIWLESKHGVGTSVFVKLKSVWDENELI